MRRRRKPEPKWSGHYLYILTDIKTGRVLKAQPYGISGNVFKHRFHVVPLISDPVADDARRQQSVIFENRRQRDIARLRRSRRAAGAKKARRARRRSK